MPFALAVLLTFVLTSPVSWLEWRGLRRISSVLLVVCLAFLLLGTAGWAVMTQVSSLVDDLPRYKNKVRERVGQLQTSGGRGWLRTVQDFLDEVEKAGQPVEAGQEPVVRLEPPRPSLSAQLQALVGRFLGVFSMALAVLFLVICMLIYREDLRNQLIRLAGSGRLVLTTRALDETGQRIARYLLGRSLVNIAFGVAVGLGLFMIGVPYGTLWGFLAGAFRFVPSVGVWFVAPFPTALALLTSSGLTQPLLVIALFLALEMLNGNVIERGVYGPSIGVAPVPLLLSIMFWTGLWGMIGLVLATPMMVCLAVLSKYVRQLDLLAVLLGSRPALKDGARYYQRLLARDRYEAEMIVKDYLGQRHVAKLYDEVLVPALGLVRRGRQRGELGPDDAQYILQTTRELLEALDQRVSLAATSADSADRVRILALPACDEVDELPLLMLRNLCRRGDDEVRLAGIGDQSPGMLALVLQERPAVVVIGVLAPGELAQAHYLCQRLRSQLHSVRIVVGCWGSRRNSKKSCKRLLSAGADRVVTTLREARSHLAKLTPTSVQLQGTS
jgi:predicted PurR-regulated permease PerM